VSACGRRCEARKRLEFDHVQAYARGGEATVAGLRLRCRAHNQYEAERTYGPEFMRHKRLVAAETRARARACERAAVAAEPVVTARATEPAPVTTEDRDVVPWLRTLGFSAAEARRAAERCADIPEASMKERVRVALSSFRVRGTRVDRAADGQGGRGRRDPMQVPDRPGLPPADDRRRRYIPLRRAKLSGIAWNAANVESLANQ
jgi:hypothetical protein